MTTIDHTCPCCEAPQMQAFYSVDAVPVNSCLVVGSEAEGRSYPTGDLRVAVCERCGFITNTAFDVSLTRYDPAYEETQIFSPTFTAFQDRLIRRLIETYDLRGKTVVEIGCGKGDFLARMAELGDITGIGIDPSSIASRLTGVAAERVRFINEFYGPQHAGIQADMIICRHALEHIPDVAGLLRNVRAAAGDRQIPIFFELPETLRVLRERAYWDIYFEHCNYFTPGSLARAFERYGFRVTDVRLDYDDQYLLLEAYPAADARPSLAIELDSAADVVFEVDCFRRDIGRRLYAWRDYFTDARRDGKTVALWGSGSKAVAFMSTIGVNEDVAYVTDINPHRHGTYLVGTGKRIVSPPELAAAAPDEVIVMNPVYEEEVTAMLRGLGSRARVLTAESPIEALV